MSAKIDPEIVSVHISTLRTMRAAIDEARAENARLRAALEMCRDLLDWGEVRCFLSIEMGEQARLHAAINATRAALA